MNTNEIETIATPEEEKEEVTTIATPEEEEKVIATPVAEEVNTAETNNSLVAYQSKIPAKTTQDGLFSDNEFIEASKITYSRLYGKDFIGSDSEAVSWGKSYAADQLYSLTDIGKTLSSQPDTWATFEKEAYLYLTKAYGNTDFSVRGSWEFVKSFATDWGGWGMFWATTALTPETIGIAGFLAREATIGGIIASVHNVMQQNISVSFGLQESVSTSELVVSGAEGAVGGALLAGTGRAVQRGYRKLFPRKDIPNPYKIQIIADDVANQSAGRYTPQQINILAENLVEQLYKLSAEEFENELKNRLVGGSLTANEREVVDRALKIYQEVAFDEFQKAIIRSRMTNVDANTIRGGMLDAWLEESLSETVAKFKLVTEANQNTKRFSGSMIEGRKQQVLNFLENYPKLKDIFTKTSKLYDQHLEVLNSTSSSEEAKHIAREAIHKLDKQLEKEVLETASNLFEKDKQGDAIKLLANFMQEKDKANQPNFLTKIGNNILETAIANVFSLKTILVAGFEGISTYTKPLTNVLFNNPFNRRAWEKAFVNYNVMHSTIRASWQAVKDVFSYEKNLLNRDNLKYFPHDTRIKGKLGEAIRFIPRLIMSTDELISRVAYNSERASQITNAILKDCPNVTKDKLLKTVTAVLEGEKFLNTFRESLIHPIIEKGISKKLNGQKLVDYVLKEFNKKRVADYTRRGFSKSAFEYAEDQTYKNMDVVNSSKFISEGINTLNNSPYIQLLLGTFFARSVINVLETGARYTPVVNLFLNSMKKDISGANGALRQAHANTALTVSQALVVLSLGAYYNDKATGSKTFETPSQQRLSKDAGNPNHYSLKLGDSWWSFDTVPMAVPIKITLALAELLDHLDLRRSQGEVIDEGAVPVNQILETTKVVFTSALIDHPFLKSFDTMRELYDRALGDSPDESTVLHYFMSKMAMTTPKTFKQFLGDAELRKPSNYLEASMTSMDIGLETVYNEAITQLNKYFDSLEHIRTPYSYDILGNTRPRRTNKMASIYSDLTSKEERQAHLNDTQKEVLDGLYKLVEATGTEFRTPVKSTLLDVDLRGIVINKETGQTAYDRWHEIYKTYAPEDKILKILRSRMPTGTHAQVAKKVTKIQETVNKLYDKAFKTLMKEEPDLLMKYKENIKENKLIKKGRRDSQRFQF